MLKLLKMTNVNNRWVLMKDGEPFAVNLSEKEANKMLYRYNLNEDLSEYTLFWDEYFEFENK